MVTSEEAPIRKQGTILWLYVLSTFAGALLLFQVEPMIAKQITPRLGGTPRVWITSMLFFQLILLAGYAFAHLAVVTRDRRPVQLGIVCIPLGLALATLPIGLPDNWLPPAGEDPSVWLLLALGLAIGLPFFTLASTSPLLQSWFSRTGHRSANDPYFLYAASNLGSLIGLLSYPFLVEPSLGLDDQFSVWSIAYIAYAATVIACGIAFVRAASREAGEEEASTPDASKTEPEAPISQEIEVEGGSESTPDPRLGPVTWRRRMKWLVLAFLPSSLLLGVTSYITTDLVAVPLLWVIPLSLYLISFVVVFGRRHNVEDACNLMMPLLILSFLLLLFLQLNQPIFATVMLVLLLFFAGAVVCHGRLAADRPSTDKLTEYFLFLAIGGALGGIFNAILAPFIFNQPYEFSLAIVLSFFFRPRLSPEESRNRRLLWRAAPAALAFLPVFVALGVQVAENNPGILLDALGVGVPALFLLVVAWRWPKVFAAGVSLLAAVIVVMRTHDPAAIFLDRNFFGVTKVVAGGEDDAIRSIVHGSTIHGVQFKTEEGQCLPTSYYFLTGPAGVFLTEFSDAHSDAKVAVVGLGAGTMATFSKPSQEWTFFEIDPLIVRVAEDPNYFSYLTECIDGYDLVLGDGRLAMAEEPNGKFDLIALDAFSSDAIPVHLVTTEAIALYKEKLTDDGLILVNITNNYLNLESVVANVAAANDLRAFQWYDAVVLNENEKRAGKFPSRWMVLTQEEEKPDELTQGIWEEIGPSSDAPLWTDDFSNLLGVMVWAK